MDDLQRTVIETLCEMWLLPTSTLLVLGKSGCELPHVRYERHTQQIDWITELASPFLANQWDNTPGYVLKNSCVIF